MPVTNFGPPQGPPKKPDTASKFLPFLTDKSSPLTIFKTLNQRTKGMSNQDLCILFSASLSVGINSMKRKAKNHSSTNDIFKHLISIYPQFRPSKKNLKFWEFVLRNHGIDKIKTDADYSKEETIILFTCVAKYKEKFLKKLNFDLDIEMLKTFSNSDYKVEIKDINVDFKNEKNRIGFRDLEELKAYLAYNLTINDSPLSLYPVLVSNQDDYELKNCVSPYPNEEEEHKLDNQTPKPSQGNYSGLSRKFFGDLDSHTVPNSDSIITDPPWTSSPQTQEERNKQWRTK